MTRTTLLKNKHHTDLVSQHKSLSILFNSDGFSFCIRDVKTQKVLSFTNYKFEESIATPELLLGKILRIFGSDNDLQQDFEHILIVHQNNLATIVPSSYFDENQLKTYLDYNIKTLPSDFITFDEIDSIKAKNVYVPYVNINNFFFQNFGEFEFKHYGTVLIEKLIANSKNTTEKQFYVYVSKNELTIVVVEKESLVLYNSFPYFTKEDFIYYILFVAEQLGLDPETFKLTFLGDIKENQDTYQITYEFIRHINFIDLKSDFFNSSTTFTNHSNYILVS